MNDNKVPVRHYVLLRSVSTNISKDSRAFLVIMVP